MFRYPPSLGVHNIRRAVRPLAQSRHPQKILRSNSVQCPSTTNHQPHIFTMVRRAVAIPKAAKNAFVPPSQRKQVFLYVNPSRSSPKPPHQISDLPRPGINAANSTALQPPPHPRNYRANTLLSSRPEFVISLVRTPFLSPRYAQFRVPLNFNKLDLRDYLQNLYGVGVVSVRSYIEQQPITRMTRDGRNIGAWRRPQAQKRMTVELREPFVYPEEPKDLSPYVFPYCFFSCGDFMLGFHDDRIAHAVDGIEYIANELSLIQTDGRRALGTPAKSGRTRCKRRCRMDLTRPRSPIPICARPSRSRLRRLRRTPRSGGHRRRCWVGTLRIRSSLGQEGSRRRLSGCRSSDWAALDSGVWLS